MWLILIVFVATLLYYLIQRHYSYWSRNGIPGPKPLPIFGNFGKSFLGKISGGEIVTDIYRKYDKYPFVGFYKLVTPVLLIRDTEFIKNILVKDFKHFHDNDIFVDKDLDPIFGRNPFVLKGMEWKNKRAQLTNCFTSGKIKGMHPYLEHNCLRMVKYIEDETKTSTALEARDVCIRLTLDNTAICAFGVEGKTFDEPYSEFRELADQFFSPDSGNKLENFKRYAVFTFPVLTKYVKIKLVSREVEDRLFKIVKKTIKYRKENNVVRNDFLDACTSLSTKNGLFKDIDIVAHGASFFADGYETSSRVMSFLIYELAGNQDAQDNLRKELTENFEANENKFTYESIHDMPYLEACLKEALRKRFIVHMLSKICTEDYTYTSTNPDFKKLTINLKVGDCIAIPVIGLQTDSKYFDEPDKFIPERFLTKEEIPRFSYLPWGDGPRVCLGQRFATTQIKLGIAHIFKNFRCTVNSKTQLPLKFDPYYIMVHALGGLWVDFKKID